MILDLARGVNIRVHIEGAFMLKKSTHFITIVSILLVSQLADAKVYLNSMCTMNADSKSMEIKGDDNKDKKFPWASISKVATSLWAVEKLGAFYRYTTRLHINKVSDDVFDLHIEGGRDPIFGRSAGYFLLSELNRKGLSVKKIRNLTFDENFLIRWNLEESAVVAGETKYYNSIEEQTQDIKLSIRNNLATPPSASAYNTLKTRAARSGIKMEDSPSIEVENIDYVSRRQFRPTSTTISLAYRSAPLHQILKNMNNRSNNYISDVIFWNLGGSDNFQAYMKDAMDLTKDEIEFNLGSGNNAHYLYGGEYNYNEGTCEAMIKVIYRLNLLLERAGLQLSHVMAVADVDEQSSLKSYVGSMAGAVIAKTGTVSRAKTLAGSISTQEGEFYFAVLMHMDRLNESGSASHVIKSKIIDLISRLGGPKRINYTKIDPLPFDKSSILFSDVRPTARP